MHSSRVQFTAVVGIIFGTVFYSSDYAIAQSLRILPIGDSITAGYTDNPNWNEDFNDGYRSGLYTRLTDAGYDFQFVGGSAEPFNDAFPGDPTRGGTYTPSIDLNALGQGAHRGYGGVNAAFFNANMFDRSSGPSWFDIDDPDVVLLHIGTNGQFTGQIDNLIGNIFNAKSDVKIIVSQIIPKLNSGTNAPNWVTYNNYICDTLVPNYLAAGRDITLVDQYTPFLTDANDPYSFNSSYFATGNHPNNAGYDVMAQTWFQGIQAVAVPEPTGALVLGCAGLIVLVCRRRNIIPGASTQS